VIFFANLCQDDTFVNVTSPAPVFIILDIILCK